MKTRLARFVLECACVFLVWGVALSCFFASSCPNRSKVFKGVDGHGPAAKSLFDLHCFLWLCLFEVRFWVDADPVAVDDDLPLGQNIVQAARVFCFDPQKRKQSEGCDAAAVLFVRAMLPSHTLDIHQAISCFFEVSLSVELFWAHEQSFRIASHRIGRGFVRSGRCSSHLVRIGVSFNKVKHQPLLLNCRAFQNLVFLSHNLPLRTTAPKVVQGGSFA